MTNSNKADFMLLGVTLLAAVSWIMSRNAVQLMPPLLFMSLRFLLAASLLVIAGHERLRGLNAQQWRRCAGGGLVFALAMSFWVMGISSATHVGEGAFLTSLGVVLVPLMGRLFFREAQPPSTWVALPVAGCGLALLALRHGFQPERGQVFYIVSAIIFAISFHLNARAVNPPTGAASVPAIALTAIMLGAVGLLCGAASLLLEPWQTMLAHFSLAMAGWIVASAVAGTAARFLLQIHAQSLASNTHGVIIMIMEPVWVAMLAAACFGESMAGRQLAGCALIFMAILINRAATLRQWLGSLF
jgi:drug/metabolite transporter (DMT)-like permease